MKEFTVNETPLFDEFGDLAAMRASLEDVLKFINQCFPSLIASAHYEDYDDYGCEHYIKIKGECADILLKKDYGGMFCPSDSLVCSVQAHAVSIKSSRATHQFCFKNGKEPKDVHIGSDYANKIREYIVDHKQYLVGVSELFYRVDTRIYEDGRGLHQLPYIARPYSYDLVYVSDEDFYTDHEQRLDIQSCKKDVDEYVDAISAQERYFFDTPVGAILVESPLPSEFNEDIYFSDNYVNQWVATHIVSDSFPKSVKGESLQDAYDKLFDELAKRQKGVSWYSQMINVDNERVYGLALDMSKDGKYHSPGEKLYVKLVGQGATMEQAIEDGLTQAGVSVTPQVIADLCAGRKNECTPGYSVHPLSDVAVEFFSKTDICYDYSIVVMGGVIEKESRLREGDSMREIEWALRRTLHGE